MRSLLIFFSVIVSLTFSGCIRSTMSFKKLEYPASATRYIYDSNHQILEMEKNLHKVGELGVKERVWGLFYSLIPVGGGRSRLIIAMNQQIKNSGGWGVVNTAIASKPCGWTYAVPFTLIPLWPTCFDVTITGDIIKSQGGANQ